MIDELDDLIVTVGLAIALNPLIEPNELLKVTMLLLITRFKTIQLKSLMTQWLMTGKPYDHFNIFVQALASDIATSCDYPIRPRVN